MQQSGFKCMACTHGLGTLVLADCRDLYLSLPYRVDYWKCDECGLVQQSPLPEDTSPFYLDYPIHSKKSRWSNTLRRWLMGSSYYPARPVPAPCKLLDYGCGDGWFLQSCQGKNYQLIGFERDPEHALNLSRSLGIPVESNLAKLLANQAGTVDIVTMNFVMEHLTDLDQAFSDIYALLRPGGLFYFSAPNINSIEFKLFKRKWHGLDPPRHISFPDDRVITLLANRHGFQLEQSRNIPFPPGIAGSIPTLLTGKFRYPLFLLSMPLALAVNFLRPDSARGYWLRKA